MNEIEQKLIKCSSEAREAFVLKKDERVRILSNVTSIDETISRPIPSPYHKVRFPHFFFMNTGSIALLFTLVFTGVLSYIADQSLPGDPLYNVKTDVNENIQTLLTVSPQSKAKLQTSLAQKRLTEAEVLAAGDKFSTSSQQAIASNFKEHLDDFKVSVKEVTTVALSSMASSTATSTLGIASSTERTNAYAQLQNVSIALDALDTSSIFSSSSAQFEFATATMPVIGEATTTFEVSSSTTLFATSTADLSATSSPTAGTSTASVPTPVRKIFIIEARIIEAQTVANDGIAHLTQGEYVEASADFQKVLDLLAKISS